MAQTYPYLAFIDTAPSAGSYVIADGLGGSTSYPLVDDGWAPAVAGERTALLGNQSVYGLVEETITINVKSGASGTLQALNELAKVFDRAARWAAGKSQYPVLIAYAPQGSTAATTAAPWQALVWGPAEAGKSAIQTPGGTYKAGLISEIDNVTIRFLRSGQWFLSATTTHTATDVNSVLANLNFGGSNISLPQPYQLSIGPINVSSVTQLNDSLLIINGAYNGTAGLITANAMTSANYTSVADTTNKAAVNLLRYTPGTTVEVFSGTTNFASSDASQQYGVYAILRSNSSSTDWTIRAQFAPAPLASSMMPPVSTTPVTVLGSGGTNPRVVALGYVGLPNWDGGASWAMRVGIQASAASSSLDIEYLVVVSLDDEQSTVIHLNSVFLPSSTNVSLEIGSQPLGNKLGSYVRFNRAGLYDYATADGDCYLSATEATSDIIWLCPSGNYWRIVNGSTVQTVPVSATVYRSELLAI